MELVYCIAMQRELTISNYILLGSSIFLVLALMLYAYEDLSYVLSPFTVWALLPFLTLLTVTRIATSAAVQKTTFSLSVILTLSIYLYFDVLFINPDPQGGIMFLALPLYQLILTGFGFCCVAIIQYLRRKTTQGRTG